MMICIGLAERAAAGPGRRKPIGGRASGSSRLSTQINEPGRLKTMIFATFRGTAAGVIMGGIYWSSCGIPTPT
jgi:hypothetical protein